MDYSFENLLKCTPKNKYELIQLEADYDEVESIICEHAQVESTDIIGEEAIDVAHRRMKKELELKFRYNIPIWHDATLEWFHVSFENELLNQQNEIKFKD